MPKKFSIVIPTFSGLSTLPDTFDSILNQQSSNVEYEVVVIIDGHGLETREYVEKQKERFVEKGIRVKVRQFILNRGRFSARVKGTELAKNDYVLFVDDRVKLAPNFFKVLANFNEEVIIPNSTEPYLPWRSIVSNTLFLLRRLVYRGKQGKFEDYYIDKKNFERSPKGTTTLWVNRRLFLRACRKVGEYEKGQHLNEDTKIFRQIIEDGTKILRTSKLNIIYQPRTDFWKSLKHLYERGPRFVDYYAKPGTRFFPMLLGLYVVVLILIATAIWKPLWLPYYLLACLLMLFIFSVPLAKKLNEYLTLIIGLPLVLLSFSLGVIKGTLLKFIGK